MKRNPQLTLPEDPNINIWNYYSIMKVTSIIMENFLLVILTIPLADQSLVMNLYRVPNLPALNPKLHVQFQYQLEGEYLAITKDKQYAALPVHIGNGCEGYSSNLFIPAKSELTSEDETLTRHVFFLEFNNEHQDLTKYSLIQQLNLPQLMAKELEELPN